jgi:hypothetical protein
MSGLRVLLTGSEFIFFIFFKTRLRARVHRAFRRSIFLS